MSTEKSVKRVVVVVSGVVALAIMIAAVAMIPTAQSASVSGTLAADDGDTAARAGVYPKAGSDGAVNPELSISRRYAVAAANDAELSLLAANPELTIARRYLVAPTAAGEARWLANNPELLISRHYVSGAARWTDTTFLSANPEISLYRQYVAGYRPGVDRREELCCR